MMKRPLMQQMLVYADSQGLAMGYVENLGEGLYFDL